jgi:hypothetical protein
MTLAANIYHLSCNLILNLVAGAKLNVYKKRYGVVSA